MAKVSKSNKVDNSEPGHQRLYSLFMQTPAMIAVCKGPDMVFEFANPLYLKVVGKTDAVIGKPALEAMPELKGQPILKVLQEVYDTGKSFIGNEVPVKIDINNDGRPENVYFNFVYQAIKNKEGVVDGIMTHAVDVTDQVIARKKAEDSEAKYRNLFNSIDQGFCVIEMMYDKKGKPIDYRFLETNKVFEKQTGLKKAVGKTVCELVPDFESHWFDRYGAVAQTGKSSRFTDGSEAMGRWFDVDASRVGGPDSHKVAVLFTDITERKQAEKHLLDSEERFRIMADAAPNMVWALNPDGTLKYANQFAMNYLGTTYEEFVRQNWAPFIHQEDMPVVHQAIGQAIQSEEPYSQELRLRRKDGVYRWHLSQGAPSHNADGKLYGYVGSVIDIHDSKQAEALLRESEERFRVMADNVPAMVWITAPDGRCTYLNQQWYEYTGQTPATGLGLGWLDAVHAEDAEEAGRIFLQANKKRQPLSMEYRLRDNQGQYRWFMDAGVPKFNESGDFEGYIGMVTEIDARKQAEESLKEQLRITEAITSNATVCLFMIDTSGLVTYMNPAAAQVTGYTAEDVIGRPMHLLVHHSRPDGSPYPEVYCPLVQTYKLGESNPTHEDVFYRKDGSPFPALITGMPIIGSSGVQATVVEFRDITEEKRSLKNLEASEARLRFMAESMPQKVFTANAGGGADYFNPQWMEYTGLEIQQITDWGWAKFVHPDDADKYIRLWKRVVQTGEPFEMEHRIRGKDGDYHWHITRAHAMRDDCGNIIKWIGSSTDIEAVKRTLSRKEQLEEMTTNLKEQQIQLIALNEAKDEFISLASHQLRTPATGVKQYLGMLMQGYAGDLTESQQEFLRTADESNERQLRIVNDLLKVARVDSGKLRLQKETTDLVALVEAVIEEQAPNFADRSQHISFVHKTPVVEAAIDQTLFRMVLENLIDNAHKYTDAGRNIQVEVRKLKKSVIFSVEDEGAGIAQEDIEKLFQKFLRLDNPFSVSSGGTGLGLYLAKKVVDLHKGSVSVTSELGRGTTFTIKLPVTHE